MKIHIYCLAVLVMMYCHSVKAEQKIAIIVNFEPFTSAEQAANAENNVDFWDANQQDETACTESYAAIELKNYIIKSTNTKNENITIAKPAALPTADYIFLLGTKESNPLIVKYDNSPAEFKTPQSFKIKTIKDNSTIICIVEGQSRIGTLYGVYEYLNRLGVQFIGLGDTGIVLPREKAQLITDISILENPAFLTRGYCTKKRPQAEDKFFIWMGRNRMNLWAAGQDDRLHLLKKLGIQLADGFHDIQLDYINPQHQYPYNHSQFDKDNNKPADSYKISNEYIGDSNSDGILTYYEAHPEWFGFHNGKRTSYMKEWYGDNFCTSNTEAVEEFGKNFIQSLINGKMKYADIVYFWMLDAGNWCECEKCSQLGTPTDRMLLLTYQINQQVQQAIGRGRLKRPIHLNTLAYQETVEPLTKPLPSDFDYNNCSITFFPIKRCYAHSFADPCCKEINEYLYNNYINWANEQSFYKGSIFVGEYFNISSFKSLPIVLPTIISKDIPWYYKNKARHFHYMHVLTDLWGTWTLNEHLLSKILWNPDIDANSAIDNYFVSYYPTTCQTTRQFYNLLEKALSNAMAWKCGFNVYGKEKYVLQHKVKDKESEIFPYNHLQYNSSDSNTIGIVEMLKYINLAREKIDIALIEVNNPEEKKRLLEDEARFTYAERTCLFYYRIIRATIFDRQGDDLLARNEFKHLSYLAAELSDMKDIANVSAGDASSPDAFSATLFIGHYNYLKQKYGK